MKRRQLCLNSSVLVVLIAVALTFFSCSDNDPIPDPGPAGFFIVNEGGFGNSNTSLSYYDYETGEVTNNIFQSVTGRPLGDQAQSMTVFEGKGYIVVQGSAKLEVINADDHTSVTTITEGLVSPRYLLGISSTKAYVSDWGEFGVTGTVKVIDLESNMVSKTIATGQGANEMLRVDNKVYVVNAGGWGRDNTVKVIDSTTDEIVDAIEVGENPRSIQQDAGGNIWVLSAGYLAYDQSWNLDPENSTKSSLTKIVSDEEVLRLEFPELTFSTASHLRVDIAGEVLYYLYDDKLFRISVDATGLPETAFVEKGFYGLSVDPASGNIIAMEASDFSSSGSMYFYNAEGEELDSFVVGIAPNGCAFIQ